MVAFHSVCVSVKETKQTLLKNPDSSQHSKGFVFKVHTIHKAKHLLMLGF